MVTIMDMTTAESFSDLERYGDEVLNANWLPQAMLQLGLMSVGSEPATEDKSAARVRDCDPETFMQRLYLAQE